MSRSPQRAIIRSPTYVGRKGAGGGSANDFGHKFKAELQPGAGRWVTMHGTHVFIKSDSSSDHPAAAGAAHNIVSHGQFFKGARVKFTEGIGPDGLGTVLSVDANTLVVQFDDRAAPTTIGFNEPSWMNHLFVVDARTEAQIYNDNFTGWLRQSLASGKSQRKAMARAARKMSTRHPPPPIRWS